MAGIEVTAAAGAGFGLIGKRPLTVLAWGLLVVVLVGLPVAALMGAVLLPLILNDQYQVHVLAMAGIFALMALGLTVTINRGRKGPGFDEKSVVMTWGN